MIYPTNLNWITLADYAPTIIQSPDMSKSTNEDWIQALSWISRNTSKNAVLAAWWDYGYWITVLGNRTSLADNATINQTRIATIAKMFMESPEKGLQTARNLKADYILIYIVAHPVLISGKQFYVLGNGGDESIIPSMVGLTQLDERKYILNDRFTDEFWNGTLIGRLIPFVRQGYASLDDEYHAGELLHDFKEGDSSVYKKEIKYPLNDLSNQSLSLVYSSPSFLKSYDRNMSLVGKATTAIFIYKIRHT